MKLQERTAIVTGGAQGIGAAIARAMAVEGADVVLADVNAEKAGEEAYELQKAGLSAMGEAVDVADSSSVARLIKQVEGRFGSVDVLVNNAAVSVPSPILELSETNWDRVISVNLSGPFLCSRAAAIVMKRNKRGKIINIASVVSQVAHPTQGAYCASKAGLVLLTKVMATELGKYNINVNAISPGAVDTPRFRQLQQEDPEFVQGRLEATPLGRLIRPDEIARAAVFLASDDSNAITGANIVIDGGSSSVWSGAVPALQH